MVLAVLVFQFSNLYRKKKINKRIIIVIVIILKLGYHRKQSFRAQSVYLYKPSNKYSSSLISSSSSIILSTSRFFKYSLLDFSRSLSIDNCSLSSFFTYERRKVGVFLPLIECFGCCDTTHFHPNSNKIINSF